MEGYYGHTKVIREDQSNNSDEELIEEELDKLKKVCKKIAKQRKIKNE